MKDIIGSIIWLIAFLGGGVLIVWLGINFYNETATWGNGVIMYMIGFLIGTFLAVFLRDEEEEKDKLIEERK